FFQFFVGAFFKSERRLEITESAGFLPIPPANRKSLARAAGNPPSAQTHRQGADRVLLPCAISQARRGALRYLAAAFRRIVGAKTAHKKTRLPAADIPNPPELLLARTVRSSP